MGLFTWYVMRARMQSKIAILLKICMYRLSTVYLAYLLFVTWINFFFQIGKNDGELVHYFGRQVPGPNRKHEIL